MADHLLPREEANERLSTLEKRLIAARERAKREAAGAVRTISGGVAGGLLGVAEAQWGPTWFGIDPALLTAVGSGLVSLFVPDKMASEVSRASADATFAIWTYKSGFRMNMQRIRRAGAPGATAPAGQLGAGAAADAAGGSVAESVRQHAA
jgi:hypothetical protein